MSATTGSMSFSDNGKANRLPRWTNTILVAVLAWALALLTLKLLPLPEAVAAQATPTNVPLASTNNAPSPVEMARQIASKHLFGDIAAKPVEKAPEVKKEEAKETKLNLQLAGVFAYTPAERAIAIISSGSNEQNAYGIGDKVSGETKLKEVHKDHVILSNRGKDEKLSLPENSTPIATRSIPQAQTNPPSNSPNGNLDANGPIDLPTTPGALRDTLARNPAMLGRIVAAEPYQENGKLLGYRITPKQNPEILEAQGIVAGDVITRVNNIQLNSQKQGIRALRNAVKAQSLDVVVLRDGIEVPLSISLAQ